MTTFNTDYSNTELLDLELSTEQLAVVAAASGPSTGGKIILDLNRPNRADGDHCRIIELEDSHQAGVFWCPAKNSMQE